MPLQQAKMNLKKLCFALGMAVLAIATRSYAADVDITRYGAVADGKTNNATAIQSAIDACNKTGGGKVVFPAGRFLSGTIVLKDNVTLQLQKDAVLLGSIDINDYQNLDPFTEGLGTPVGWALLVAVGAKHIGITGEGVIDGRGVEVKARQILTDNRPEGQRWGRRPFLLRLVRCEDINIEGVGLNYSAAWTTHYFQCSHLNISKVKIVSHGVAHNDGIDIDGCQDVIIKDCDVESGDDALCFKTTSSKMPCRNITVSGMRLKSSQGAIKIGTESMAAFENITISNCYIYNTNNGGIKLLSVDGARIQHIRISDITMVNVKTPMLIRLGSRLSVFRKDQDTQQPTGIIEDVIIKNVKAQAADTAQLKPPSGILITGVPGHPVKGLTLQNIEIQLSGGGAIADAHHEVPEAIDKYPEVKTFGPIIPAYGIWARHVEGLKLENISIKLKSNDMRPSILCEDGKDIEVANCNIPETNGSEAVILLHGVQLVDIKNNRVNGGSSGAFVGIVSNENKAIKLNDNKLPEGMKAEAVVN